MLWLSLCVGTKYKNHTTFFYFHVERGLCRVARFWQNFCSNFNSTPPPPLPIWLSKTMAHTDHRSAHLRYSIQKIYAFLYIKGMFLCFWVFSISVKRLTYPKNHTGIITKWLLTCTSPVFYLLACLEKCF